MKRLIVTILLISIFIAIPLFAQTAFDIRWGEQATYSNQPNNSLRLWAENMEGRTVLGTGKIFYVDSNVTNEGNGSSWKNALGTIDEAINKCSADRGDVIFVAQGHNESVGTGEDAIDFDVAGITVIGCGSGSLRPTIDYDDYDAGTVAIGAANITVSNIIFRASVTDVNEAIEIESAGDNFSIINCDFTVELAGTDEFASCIKIGDTANDGLIQGCKMRQGAGAAVQAIWLDADIVGLTVKNNVIWGDYSVACIKGDEASDDIIIQGNILFNGTMGGDGELNSEPAIEMADSTSGFVVDNRIVSGVATALLMRVADDMVFMNNYVSDTDGDEFSGTKEDDAASVTGHTDG